MTDRLVHLLPAALLAGTLLVGCAGGLPSQPAGPYWPTAGWRSSIPKAQGMDSAALARMLERIQAEEIPIHGLVIIRNGYLYRSQRHRAHPGLDDPGTVY